MAELCDRRHRLHRISPGNGLAHRLEIRTLRIGLAHGLLPGCAPVEDRLLWRGDARPSAADDETRTHQHCREHLHPVLAWRWLTATRAAPATEPREKPKSPHDVGSCRGVLRDPRQHGGRENRNATEGVFLQCERSDMQGRTPIRPSTPSRTIIPGTSSSSARSSAPRRVDPPATLCRDQDNPPHSVRARSWAPDRCAPVVQCSGNSPQPYPLHWHRYPAPSPRSSPAAGRAAADPTAHSAQQTHLIGNHVKARPPSTLPKRSHRLQRIQAAGDGLLSSVITRAASQTASTD